VAYVALRLLAAGVILAGCTGTAGPVPVTVNDPSVPSSADVIRYRTLTWSDFRGRRPPVSAGPHRSLGASSCVRLVPELPQRAVTEPAGDQGYRATAPRASFYAEMDRACSWWNRGMPRDRLAYLLQHEQTHFALVELHARRLTVVVRRTDVLVASRDSAAVFLQRRITALVDSAAAALVRENEAFDRETAGRYAPAAQRAWLERVELALAKHDQLVDRFPSVPE
jgi:hypothetical protein